MKHTNSSVTVTIGIPAYNEEANITALIGDLLKQKAASLHLDRIIIVSDASTDSTNSLIRSIKDTRIRLLTNKKRLGQMKSQNRIIAECKSDILVLVNADVRIPDTSFLEKLTHPIREGSADLTSCRVLPVASDSIVEHILHMSAGMKQDMYERLHDGQNIYTCHGRARAFSKRLYARLRFNDVIAEDAFSYLFCRSQGMIYQYTPTTSVYYRLPTSIADHLFQSIRFLQSRKQLRSSFPPLVVEKEYHLPREIIRTAVLTSFRKKPVFTSLYLLLYLVMHTLSFVRTAHTPTWDVSTSSKYIPSRTL